LRLPSRAAPLTASTTKSAARAAADRRKRLLLVEDNADARQTLRALLEALGHEVHEAGDGEAGIAAAATLRPDLAFVDIGLPRLDGYEVARRMRAVDATVRLVALTGYGRDEEVRRARDAGFDEHILKPASMEQLRAAIAAATSARA
jgi:CheY-like chemotaxis protein